MKFENYMSPESEIIEAEVEGVLCASGYADDSDDVELFLSLDSHENY